VEKLLKDNDEEYVRQLFEENLKDPVELVLFLEKEGGERLNQYNEQYQPYTEEIAKEISALSDKIKLTVYRGDTEKEKEYGVKNISALFIEGKNTNKNVSYYGMPSGHEFSSVLEDIVDVSKGETDLNMKIKEMVKKIGSNVEILVFVTPTCPYCPKAVRTAHQFAMENKLINGVMVEANEFPEWSEKFSVYAVPKIVINEKVQFEGAVPEDAFLNSVYEALGIKLVI
jgi:glutaredoxin-like protein